MTDTSAQPQNQATPSQVEPLWDHQSEAIANARGKPGYALLFDMGTGKTRTVIEIVRENLARFDASGPNTYAKPTVLIVCPLITCENWRRELTKYGGKYMGFNTVVLLGPLKRRIRLVTQAREKGRHIFVTNKEALQSPSWPALAQAIGPVTELVVDESQNFKDPQAKRTKNLKKITIKAEHVYILSGTPITQSPLDLWAQFQLISPSIFKMNYRQFHMTYWRDKNESWRGNPNYFPDWELRPGAEKRIAAIIAPWSMRVLLNDVRDLPPLIRQTIYTEHSKEQARVYRQLEDNYLAELESGAYVVGELALVRSLRLQQISQGIAKGDDGVVELLPCPKHDALREILAEQAPHHKCIVWCNFRELYGIVGKMCEELNLPHVFITGNENAAEKQASIDAINGDPAIRVCIGNQSAGGVGTNLQGASYMLFLSKSFNGEHDLQATARAYRAGSEIHDRIVRVDFITPDTIDEDIHDSLYRKKTVAETVYDMIQRMKKVRGII